MGIDSLQAVDFKILLEEELRCELPTSVLYDYPTLNRLAAHFLEQVLDLPTAETAAVDDGDDGDDALKDQLAAAQETDS